MQGNLTGGQVVPGFFGFVDYNAQGSADAPQRRVLLWGYAGATAQRTPNYPFLPDSQKDANDGAERGSELARLYAACVSQPETAGAEVWCMPIVPTVGNTASSYKITVVVPGTNPSKPGSTEFWIAGRAVPTVGFATTDTASTIATALGAALLTMVDLPITSVVVAGPDITFSYKHKGASGEELPFRQNTSPDGTGVYLSPGSATFATNAAGAGTVRVGTGSLVVSTTISNAMTPPQIAAAVAASWNADTYPLTAAVSTAAVIFYMANDRDVRRMTAEVITSTGTTVNLGSGATDGTGSITSITYNGTQGVGAPALSPALANLASLGPFRSWASSFVETTSLGAMATSIENASDGSITGQKMQHLTVCSPLAASVAGALATSTSPNLTATAPHYAILWSPDAGVQGYEVAARVAGARAAIWLDTPQFNWNGFEIKGSATVPLPVSRTIPDMDELNVALRTYGLAPCVPGASGLTEVVKGRTTSQADDLRLWAWSTEAQAAYHKVNLVAFLQDRFKDTSTVRYSEPKAPGIIDAASIVSAVQESMRRWETEGNYDGADLLAPAVKVKPNRTNPFRFDVDWPESPVLDLDQIYFVSHFTSPPSA